jgi:hypothetical protein
MCPKGGQQPSPARAAQVRDSEYFKVAALGRGQIQDVINSARNACNNAHQKVAFWRSGEVARDVLLPQIIQFCQPLQSTPFANFAIDRPIQFADISHVDKAIAVA